VWPTNREVVVMKIKLSAALLSAMRRATTTAAMANPAIIPPLVGIRQIDYLVFTIAPGVRTPRLRAR
jgi:hypothetical protein